MEKQLGISKNQSRFLYRFLGTKSLEELLPLYVSAVADNKELFRVLPEGLINPVVESLRQVQSEVGVSRRSEESDFDEGKILRSLSNLSGNDLLSNYVSSVTENAVPYSVITEEARNSAEGWLDELKACITGENGLFSNEFDPETYVDGFIEAAGGQRVTDILGSSIPSENADYFFRYQNVIIELKILKADFLGNKTYKLNHIRDEFLKKIKVSPGMILGTDSGIPKEMAEARFRVIREPLQRIIGKANTQIKNSKDLLNAPDASGVAIFLIDGFYGLDPHQTIEILRDPLSRHFSAVDAIIFLTFRRKVKIDDGNGPYGYLVFQPVYKPTFPDSLPDFVNWFGDLWFKYMEGMSGKKFGRHILSYDSGDLSDAKWEI